MVGLELGWWVCGVVNDVSWGWVVWVVEIEDIEGGESLEF